MEKLPVLTLVSMESQKKSEERKQHALMVRKEASSMPAVSDRAADIEIPRSAWSAWKEIGKPRCLRRHLTDNEVEILQARRNELEPWVIGYHSAELDDVVTAIGEMYGAFPSMGSQRNEQAASRLKNIARALEPYPAWSIRKCCERIKTRGYVRMDDGRYVTERHWPPSDPEIVDLVRQEAKLYRDSFDSAIALLTAEVER